MMTANGRYVLTANLKNASERRIEAIRLIVTLLDVSERVVGYRVHSVDPLLAGTERAVRMEIIPQVMDNNMHHLLHVEVGTISTTNEK
jgi:hypothetical protein